MDEVANAKVIVEVNVLGKESGTRFFTFKARLAFAKLRHFFSTALILYYFDSECHIWVETDVSGYVIS